MIIHQHIPLGIYHLIILSPWAPSVTFALAAGMVYLFRLRSIRIPWIGLATGLSLLLVLTAATYLLLPIIFGDVESDVACISALALRGLPIYPAADAAARYHSGYGPFAYLAHVPPYLAFGTNLFAFKLPGFLAFIMSILGLYRICRRYAAPGPSLVGLGCASVVLFRYLGVTFQGRSDPLILCMTVLCIWIVIEGPVWAIVLTGSITFAVVPNLKVSGFAYLLPIFGLIVMRKGWRIAAAAGVLGALLFPLPFVLREVSLANYVFILKTFGENHGLSLDLLLRNVQYSVILLAPVLAIAFSRLSSPRRPSFDQMCYWALIACGMAASCIFGSTPGAGSYHLIPYVAPILHLYFWMRSTSAPAETDQAFLRFAIAWTLAMFFFSSTRVQVVLSEFRSARSGHRIISEIRRAEKTYQGRTLEVGIGEDFLDRRTRYSYLTTFDGQPYTISGTAVRDLQFGGVELPEATVRYIESCGTQIWLIPKGEQPFIATNPYYTTYHRAFDERFRQAFLTHYGKVDSGDMFDVWSCRNVMSASVEPVEARSSLQTSAP